MNRLVRGLLAGGLVGVAAAGTMIMAGRRHQMRMGRMAHPRMLRRRARHTIRMVTDNAFRLGSAFKSGTVAFANRLTEKRGWGRT